MFHLIYASTAAKPFSTKELLGLLAESREKNARLGITGILLYKDGSFMQALEGDEETVRTLYESIQTDSRHQNIVTILAVPLPSRQFADWSMAFKNLDDEEIGSAPGYSPNPNLLEPSGDLSWQASAAMHLLATFMHENLAGGTDAAVRDTIG